LGATGVFATRAFLIAAGTATASLFTTGAGAADAAFAETFVILRAIQASINYVAVHNIERSGRFQEFFVQCSKNNLRLPLWGSGWTGAVRRKVLNFWRRTASCANMAS
jgi:hypothetical protein